MEETHEVANSASQPVCIDRGCAGGAEELARVASFHECTVGEYWRRVQRTLPRGRGGAAATSSSVLFEEQDVGEGLACDAAGLGVQLQHF